MALTIKDRVKETTTTTGTGTYTLAGAVTGFETFTANLSNSDTTYYACTDNTDFEVGLGTFTSSGTTLARTTVLASSNSNNAVNWSSGTRTIFMTYPADKAVFLDASDDVTLKSSDGAILKLQSSDTTITDGSVLGAIEFSAPDEASGTDAILTSASIVAEADATFAADANNTDLVFKLGASEAASEKMRLTHEGNVTVSGDVSVGDDLTVEGGQIDLKTDSGSVAKLKFYCESSNAHAQTLQAQPHSASASDVLTLPTGGNSTLVSRLSTDTLTNKSIDSDNNTITNIVNADIKSSAAIAVSKTALTAGTGISLSTNTLNVDAAQTGITSLLATDIKIGEDDQTKIDFETADTINFYAGNEKQLILTDGALTPGANNILDLGSSGVEFKDAFFDGTVTADAFAGPLTGNVTGNASGTAATVTGAAQSNITSLGTLTTLTVDNVIINGTTIGHTDDTDLITLADGIATVAGEISVTTLDIGGTNVTSTAAELNALDGITAVVGELNALDIGSTAVGTAVASKAVILDSNKDYTGIRNFTITGDADVDGTLEADAITVNGSTLASVIADEATALAIALG